jgi:hypothetical protein
MHANGLYMNDGAAAVIHDDGRICLVDIQSKAKRGAAYKSECKERDANARLIAAAPDLLAACEAALGCLDAIDNTDDWPPMLDLMLRKAIAKATGAAP